MGVLRSTARISRILDLRAALDDDDSPVLVADAGRDPPPLKGATWRSSPMPSLPNPHRESAQSSGSTGARAPRSVQVAGPDYRGMPALEREGAPGSPVHGRWIISCTTFRPNFRRQRQRSRSPERFAEPSTSFADEPRAISSRRRRATHRLFETLPRPGTRSSSSPIAKIARALAFDNPVDGRSSATSRAAPLCCLADRGVYAAWHGTCQRSRSTLKMAVSRRRGSSSPSARSSRPFLLGSQESARSARPLTVSAYTPPERSA